MLRPEQDWPSDDSEDDDYDPEKVANSHSSTDSFESDSSSEASSGSMFGSLEDELLALTGKTEDGIGGKDNLSEQIGSDYEETTDFEVISGPRQRKAVDYIKLNDVSTLVFISYLRLSAASANKKSMMLLCDTGNVWKACTSD